MAEKMTRTIHESSRGPLSGEITLVTGGSRGIGRAIALRLASLGAAVAVCGRDAAALQSSEAALRATGVPVFSCIADVTRAADTERLAAETQAALGPVSILINNAGIGLFGPAHERTEQEWDRLLDTNLKGVFLVSRAVIPTMIARRKGHILNISSLAGKNTFANGGLYCASKWGLQGLSGCMAEDLREYGIRVSTVCPGSVATEFSPRTDRDLSKLLQADDVAHVVEMLVTQGAQSFVSEVQMRPLHKP